MTRRTQRAPLPTEAALERGRSLRVAADLAEAEALWQASQRARWQDDEQRTIAVLARWARATLDVERVLGRTVLG